LTKEVQQLAALEEQARKQDVEIEALRAELRGASSDAGADSVEAERQRATAERLRQELEGLQVELAQIGREANDKIGAANGQIRALRAERDEAIRDVERASSKKTRLFGEKDTISAENIKLAEQKEALLKIVEDLHQTCADAGLGATTRKSLDQALGPKVRH